MKVLVNWITYIKFCHQTLTLHYSCVSIYFHKRIISKRVDTLLRRHLLYQLYQICKRFDFRAKEPQILDYRTQQYKLIPALASCMAMMFSANWLWDMYNNVTSELEQGDMERLPEVNLVAWQNNQSLERQ